MFTGIATQEKDSVGALMLKVAEAVAQHWRDVWVYYLALTAGMMSAKFFFIGFLTNAKSGL